MCLCSFGLLFEFWVLCLDLDEGTSSGTILLATVFARSAMACRVKRGKESREGGC